MKNIKQKIVATVLLLLCTLTMSAFEVDGISYSIREGRYAEVTDGKYCSGNVTIPNKVVYVGNEYVVESIGLSAFGGNTSLTSVNLPNTVVSIGKWAFEGCTSLTSVNLPNSLKNIEEYAYRGCTSLISVEIPNSVESIGSSAFSECTSLASVILPNSLKNIEKHAFSGCTSLISVEIPNSVESIGSSAFSECTSLASVILPNSLKTIESWTFEGCLSLTSINVEATNTSYTSIEGVLFNKDVTTLIVYPVGNANCTYTIPNSVTTIGDRAFWYCSSLTSINVEATNTSYTSIEGVLFNKDVTTLIVYPVGNANCTYTIPNSVTTIGDGAFGYCSSLTSIDIPNSVTTIGDMAFEGCESLTSITIPSSVTTIGEYASRGCSSLTSIDLGNGVTTIGDGAFSWCESLTSIDIPNSVTTIGYAVFYNCSRLTDVYNYALTPQNLPDDAFSTFGTLHVHKGYKDVYSMAEGWNKFNIVDDIANIANIAFEKDVYSCAVGESFTPVVTGIDADELEWASSDSSVLYIDPVYHLCLGRKDGIAFITVTQKTVPHNSATVRVLVGDVSGITPLTTDNDAITDVYSLDGRRTTSGQHNGVSIVRTADGKTRKVMKN